MLNLVCVRIQHKFHEETDKQITGCAQRCSDSFTSTPNLHGAKGGELKHAGNLYFPDSKAPC